MDRQNEIALHVLGMLRGRDISIEDAPLEAIKYIAIQAGMKPGDVTVDDINRVARHTPYSVSEAREWFRDLFGELVEEAASRSEQDKEHRIGFGHAASS